MIEAGLGQPALAFAAGLLTVAAPCALPLLPVVLGTTTAGGPGTRPVFIALGFALSFATVAFVFGSARSLLGLDPQVIRDLAALLLVAFGLAMIWPGGFQRAATRAGPLLAPLQRLGDRTAPVNHTAPGNRTAPGGRTGLTGPVGGLLVGVSLGAIWTPCAGPVLATILTLVASQTEPRAAAALIALYATGAALPMLVIGYGGQWVIARVRVLASRAHRIQQAMGGLVVAVGLLTLLQYDTVVTVWLSAFYPAIAEGL